MILGMRKLTLVALDAERNSVLDVLAWSGCCEVVDTYPFDRTEPPGGDAAARSAALRESLSELSVALRFSEQQRALWEKSHPAKTRDKPLFSCRRSLTYEEFRGIAGKGVEVGAELARLGDLRARSASLCAELSQKEALCARILPFAAFPEPLSALAGTPNTAFFLGTVSCRAEAVDALSRRVPDCECKLFASEGSEEIAGAVLFVACPREEEETLRAELPSVRFSPCVAEVDGVPARELSRLRGECEEARLALDAIAEETLLGEKTELLEDWFDYLTSLLERAEDAESFRYTQKTFVLNAWVPENAVGLVEEALRSAAPACEVSFSLPEESDEPPTLAKNKKLVAPFEAVTNMYSVPSPYERDPNLFVMIFFLIFFGIMLSDAGYGLVLAAGAFLLLRFAKMETPTRRMIFILGLGGVSTLLWGTLFGGWFGISLSADSPSAVIRLLNRLKWFSPLEEPLLMLGLCMGLGVVQILAGMALRFAALVKEGKLFDALFDVGSWFLFFLGLGMFAASSFPKLFPLRLWGLECMAGGLLLLLLTQGRRERGIIKKIGKGLASLYGLVGYLSDILSYARLFGLGLATGVIALVMNTLAVMLFSNPWTALLGVVIAAGGHLFNLAINVLGAYVHDCRLQYIEFFSRFYTGGGRVFRPMLSGLKYNVVK